jgi:hypothetical protein
MLRSSSDGSLTYRDHQLIPESDQEADILAAGVVKMSPTILFVIIFGFGAGSSVAISQTEFPNAQACFDARESFPSWATTLTERSDQYHMDAVCLDKSTGRQVSPKT